MPWASFRSGLVGLDPRRHHLVVERRHDHLDVVLGDVADALKQVLLGQLGGGRRGPLGRRRGQLVDELVDADRPERAYGRTRDDLAAGRAHVD